jgi:hypothetical protein
MEAGDVGARLEGVLKQLEEQREVAKQALDEAWGSQPEECERLIEELSTANARFVSFRDVAEKALPLLSTLERIESLRRSAVDQLDKLRAQAEESRQMKSDLHSGELDGLQEIPPLVGEHFDLSLLNDEQLRLIVEARKALSPGDSSDSSFTLLPEEESPLPAPEARPETPETSPEEFSPQAALLTEGQFVSTPNPEPIYQELPTTTASAPPKPSPTPNAKPALEGSPDAAPSSSPPTTDVTLDELIGSGDLSEEENDRSVLSLVMEDDVDIDGATEPDFQANLGLAGDEELDAMFEEAVVSENEGVGESPAPPSPEPFPTPEPPQDFSAGPPISLPPSETTAPTAAVHDPLEELLTRAGFEE